MFRDEEFADACLEITTPSLTKYEMFSESYNKKIRVFKASENISPVNSYKMFGVLDTPPNICAECVLDLDYRKKWDPYLKNVNVISNNGMKAIYCLTTLPFPISNRDFVYVQEMRELMYNNKHYWVVLSSVDMELNKLVPPKKGVVRLDSCYQAIAMTTDGNKGCKVFCSYSETSESKIPSWFLSWLAQKGLPSFLDKMSMACDNYAKMKKNDTRRLRNSAKEYSCGGAENGDQNNEESGDFNWS